MSIMLDRYYTKPWMTRALLEHVEVGGRRIWQITDRGISDG